MYFCPENKVVIYSFSSNGSPCYNVSYYNYISTWPYYMVIHFTVQSLHRWMDGWNGGIAEAMTIHLLSNFIWGVKTIFNWLHGALMDSSETQL